MQRGIAGAVEPALENLRGGAEIVLEEERLAERQQKLEAVAQVEAGRRTALRAPRGAQVGRVGPFPIPFEVRARLHDGRRVGGERGGARRRAASIAPSNCRWL